MNLMIDDVITDVMKPVSTICVDRFDTRNRRPLC